MKVNNSNFKLKFRGNVKKTNVCLDNVKIKLCITITSPSFKIFDQTFDHTFQ